MRNRIFCNGWKRRVNGIVTFLTTLGLIIPWEAVPLHAACVSDIPMETSVLSPPPNIMFVYDNSGSMDWEFLTEDTEGMFWASGTYYQYIYDLDDNVYRSHLDGAAKGYWKTRWSGYNRIFYNQHVTYLPWPNHQNADTRYPRSNPEYDTPTIDLNDVYLSLDEGTVIVDNKDRYPAFRKTGTWRESNHWPEYNGSSYDTRVNGSEAVFTPSIPFTGSYDVSAWWPCSTYSDTNAKITIIDSTGSPTIIYKDQRADQNNTPKPGVCGEWIPLGQYQFAQGRTGSVRISRHAASTGDSTVADAVKFDYTGPTLKVDIRNAHYFAVNDADGDEVIDPGEVWLVNFVHNGTNWTREYYQFIRADDLIETGELVLRTIAEVPDSIRPKVYDEQGNFVRYKTDLEDLQNFANWFSYYRRRELTAKAAVSRSIADLERVYVGIYTINTGVRQPVLPIKVYTDAIIVDNKDSAYSETSGWYNSGSPNPYNNNARYTTTSGRYATWTPNLPQSGDYTVYAWWNCYNNRDQHAKYTITHAGGDTIVYKNQRMEPGNVCGEWVSLGTYTFNAGTSGKVKVERHSGSNGHSTLADAVKFEFTSGSVNVDSTDQLLDRLYGIDSDGGTPLRTALLDVGRYFDADDGLTGNLGSAPWTLPEDGGACQQAFSIVMTDGYWNGSDPGVGNQDGDQGSPYADGNSDTLADVAMKFYKEDLANGLDNIVPTNSCDDASHQHMVTYGVSFGLYGSLDVPYYTQNGTDPCLQNVKAGILSAPVWPNPHSCWACPYKIDDLWHASVNGRGAFFSAANPEELVESIHSIMENIEGRLASGASVSVNSEELNSGTVLYQSSYDGSQWTGDLQAFPVDPLTGEIKREPSDILWSASDQLQLQDWDTGRVIVTHNGTNGVPFRFDRLSDQQKTALDPAWGTDDTKARNIVDFIRGKEVSGFRARSRKLGDLVHSAPLLVDNTIYVGGNDGMLHAFDTETGNERFAYVPGFVYENLPALADPSYQSNHKFFVDLSPVAKEISSTQTLLVGGLGKGGKGYFALDIENAELITDETSAASRVLWEFPSSPDPDMGYSFSVPSIVQVRDTTKPGGKRWAVIFGNGYGSANGNAVLYVVDALNGQLIRKIDTGIGGDNGLSTPAVVDVNADFVADYAYAGDLKGNLWKFDLKGLKGDPANWEIAFSDGTNPQPLFQALGQPITTRPDVMKHCKEHGYMVVFGTGKYLCDADRTDATIQSVYGIWDYGDDADDSEYLGSFNRADGRLSNQPADVTLLKQEVIDERNYMGHYLRTLTDNKAHWYTVPDTAPQKTNPGGSVTSTDNEDNDGDGVTDEADEAIAHAGWYFDLPISGERVIKDVFIRDGKAILLTFIPNESPCSGGGQSILHEMDACSGARLDKPQFDINGDGIIDSNDTIPINGVPVPPTGIGYPYLLHNPVFLRLPSNPNRESEELKIFASAQGGTVTVREQAMRIGFYYWIER
ncbi:MAG: PQQ-binding-like beta-propeller repeat protein [Deltaproteobacteria bacterium]